MAGESVVALRVSQLDATELDNELLQLMKKQLTRVLKYVKPDLLSKYDPEVIACLRLLIWRFSVLAAGATIGQQLLNLKYRREHAPPMGQWITRTQKILYGCILIGCPWLKERATDILSLLRLNSYSEKFTKLLNWLDIGLKAGALLNFLVFLQKGCYGTLAERLLKIRPVYPNKQGIRELGFEFMTRELLWHGFSEFLFFILPLINFRRIKNFIYRKILPSSKKGSGTVSTERTQSDFMECVVCGEWPMNPHQIGCKHIFCYYCVRSNYKADPGFTCPICGWQIENEYSLEPVKNKIL